MPPEITNLVQRAVLWPWTGTDVNGNSTVGSAIEIPVRWEPNKAEMTSATDKPIAKSVTVYVDREITIGSRMRLGKLVDLPSPVNNLQEVVDYEEIPDIKGRNYQRTVTLMRR